ncbi:GPW/gp25 family protein [Streptomyces sp. NPDC020801]|uniref:GPW/gp25 family protein n=1 Tax=unclassified Streptomyces TaxID=2593676 RepID=UPI00379A6175
MSELFIGRGWAWPMGVSPSGGVAMVEGWPEIEQSIRLILGTEPGERPMRPEFGCAIRDQVFGSFDASTSGAIAREVWRALDRWEPRIVVDDVDVVQRVDEPDVLHIHVRYHLATTNSRRNLVHPFYVIPPHGDTEGTPAAQAASPPGEVPAPGPSHTAREEAHHDATA